MPRQKPSLSLLAWGGGQRLVLAIFLIALLLVIAWIMTG